MAHVRSGGLVPHPAVQLHYIVIIDVAVALVVFHDGGLTGLAGGVIQPLGVAAAGEGGAHLALMHGGGIKLLGVLLSQGGGVAAGGQLVLDLLRGSLSLGLGGVKGGLLFLVSQVHSVAFLVGGGGVNRGLDGKDRVVKGVQGVLVLLVVGLQLLVRVGQVVLVVLLIVGSSDLGGDDILINLLRHVGAVIGAQIVVQVGVTVGTGGLLHLLQVHIHIGLALSRQSVALLLGGVVDHGDLGEAVNGLVEEVVIPGGAGLLILDLILGIHAGVKAGVHAHLRVVQGLRHGVVVIILYGGGGNVFPVDGQGGGPLLEETVVPNQQSDGQDGDDHAHNDVDPVHAVAFFFRFVVAPLGVGRALAVLLFSGCTHS